jgi:hypothetical protein
MDDRESIGTDAAQAPERVAADTYTTTGDALESTGAFPANEDLLSGTGSIPRAAALGSLPDIDEPSLEEEPAPARTTTSAPRYVRQRTPHRSQGTLDDLADDDTPAQGYTHDSNIAVGGATPLSGMAYRRSRSNMSRVRSGTRYGQYLEIPKGRRSIFASRERARRRRSVLALLAVITLLVFAAMFIWNMMQNVLG